jgi:arylsulfatase A-like enzyme
MKKITRRTLLATGSALAAAPGILATASPPPAPRPNIVWIVVHDVHAPLIGCYGNALARTPALDSMAAEGLRYTNAFTTTPVCSPSRFAMVTGTYPSSCAPAHQMRAEANLPDVIKPLPLLMRAAGYYCINNVFTDYNLNADEGALWDECDIKAHWRKRPAGKPFFAVYNYLITHEGQAFNFGKTETDPAQATVPPFLPDLPEVRANLARNIDMINKQDFAVAHLLQELAEDGLGDNTFVFFTADHGGIHPRSKRYCYDDGLNIPLLVRVPAAFKHVAHSPLGAPNDELVSLVDMAPTTLALAGLPVPQSMAGRAFLGAHRAPERSYAFSMRDRMDERYDLSHTVRDKRYRYIRNYNPHRIYAQHEGYEWQSPAYQAWERAHLAGGLNATQAAFWNAKPVEELYDTQADPHSIHNLAGDPAHGARLADMRRALETHILEVHDNCFIPEGASAEGYTASRLPGAYPLRELLTLTNLVLERDPKNIPQFLKGLDDHNEIRRFWNAQGLVMAGALTAQAGKTIAARLAAEPVDHVRCALAEAAFAAGRQEEALAALVLMLQPNSPNKTQLRALNVLTALTRTLSGPPVISSIGSTATTRPKRGQRPVLDTRWTQRKSSATRRYRPAPRGGVFSSALDAAKSDMAGAGIEGLRVCRGAGR